MKKLLVLALVLSLATMANAALTLQINAVGGTANEDGSITMMPSDTLVISITTPGGVMSDADAGDWIMVADIAAATVSGGISANTNWWGNYMSDDAVAAGAPVPEGQNGVWGSVALAIGYTSIPAQSVLFQDIVFHCEAIGDTVLTIWQHDWSALAMPPIASVVIHQIPEPITMALLGLGGLFLRRRK